MIAESSTWFNDDVAPDPPSSGSAGASGAERFPDIIAGIARREESAMRAFHQEFAPLVNRLVWRLLGADREHDDVVQQAFLNLFEAAGSVRDARALPAWVARVTVNTVRRELRRRKYFRLFFSTDPPPREPEVPGADPEQRLFLLRCFSVLARLGVEERIVFSLRFVEGCTLEDVAGLAGCSLATAKRRLASARRKFAELSARDPALGAMMAQGGGS